MTRLLIGGLLLALCAMPATGGPSPSNALAQSMHFAIQHEGPAEVCGAACRVWVSAVGAITADTVRDFKTFADANDIRGMTLVLNSDGGSVLGALDLGRAVRRLGMTTTVGRTMPLKVSEDARAALSTRSNCESMCAFVLLAGVRRHVPAEARVMVHQIWLGDRRDDAVAANYSAEDLALVQHDVGSLVRYNAEMGGSAELIELALKIPPWEPMYTLSPNELRQVGLETAGDVFKTDAPAHVATTAAPVTMASIKPAAISERGWALIDKAGTAWLARRHPLTSLGDNIGSFDVMFACGDTADDYVVAYDEHRTTSNEGDNSMDRLTSVNLKIDGETQALNVVASQTRSEDEIRSFARGTVPAKLVQAFANAGAHSIQISTSSANKTSTAIRVGNVGVSANFSQLAAACGKHVEARKPTRQPNTIATASK